MTDFSLTLHCSYCEKANSVQFDTEKLVLDFKCTKCNKLTFISADYTPLHISNISLEQITDALEMSLGSNVTQATVKKKAKEYLRDLQTRLSGA